MDWNANLAKLDSAHQTYARVVRDIEKEWVDWTSCAQGELDLAIRMADVERADGRKIAMDALNAVLHFSPGSGPNEATEEAHHTFTNALASIDRAHRMANSRAYMAHRLHVDRANAYRDHALDAAKADFNLAIVRAFSPDSLTTREV